VIRNELIPEIKTLCKRTTLAPSAPVHTGSTAIPPGSRSRLEVVAIGTSTGGPNALAEVFGSLPAELPVPVVIVQHMPPMFTRLLADRLSAQFAVKVEEGRAGGTLRAGHAWIAPGDYHMILVRDGVHVRLLVHQDPPENSCRPAVDVLFRSVAQTFGAGALGVVLTGMGQDGLRGSEAIHAAGGQVIVQDEASSVVWGMPGYVARAGLADKVLPLSMIGPEIVRRIRAGREDIR
jgi:two-component system chemotaxis response regulator CheB